MFIGSGGSGMLATLAASDAGAETLVLEKAPALGGATAVSGGGMWPPNSEPLLNELGEMEREKLVSYLRNVAGKRVPQPLTVERVHVQGDCLGSFLDPVVTDVLDEVERLRDVPLELVTQRFVALLVGLVEVVSG